MSQRVSIALQVARNRRDEAGRQYVAHAKICATCVALPKVGRDWCDEGWAIIKAHRQADSEARALEAAQAASHQADMLEALLGEQLPGWVSE